MIWSYPNELDYSDKKHQNNIKQNLSALWQALKNRKVLAIVHSSAVFTAYQKATKDYIQPVMKNVAFTLPFLVGISVDKKNGLLIGLMYLLLYLFTAMASSYAGFLSEKIKNLSYKSLLAGFSLGIIGGYFFNLKLWLPALLAFSGIYMVQSLRKPILTGYLADEVPNKILTSVLSAESLYRTLLTAILAVSLGYLTDRFGLGAAFIIISSGLIGISLLLSYKNESLT